MSSCCDAPRPRDQVTPASWACSWPPSSSLSLPPGEGLRLAETECVPLAPSRVGQRGSGLSMSAARSEHEVSEIIDGLSEQEVSAPWVLHRDLGGSVGY